MTVLDQVSADQWATATRALFDPGWVRLESVLSDEFCDELERAAPATWFPLPETEGGAGVRQAGLACAASVQEAADPVRALADAIQRALDEAMPDDVDELPEFNHVSWCTADQDRHFITPHRDPDTAGGVVAIATLRGHAVFRVWDLDCSLDHAERHPELATRWTTGDGDLVLLRVGGWPDPTTRCPIHGADSPIIGERVTLTLRHNKGGYGADYFASSGSASEQPAPSGIPTRRLSNGPIT